MFFKGIRKGGWNIGIHWKLFSEWIILSGLFWVVLLERNLYSFYSTNIQNDFNFCSKSKMEKLHNIAKQKRYRIYLLILKYKKCKKILNSFSFSHKQKSRWFYFYFPWTQNPKRFIFNFIEHGKTKKSLYLFLFSSAGK